MSKQLDQCRINLAIPPFVRDHIKAERELTGLTDAEIARTILVAWAKVQEERKLAKRVRGPQRQNLLMRLPGVKKGETA